MLRDASRLQLAKDKSFSLDAVLPQVVVPFARYSKRSLLCQTATNAYTSPEVYSKIPVDQVDHGVMIKGIDFPWPDTAVSLDADVAISAGHSQNDVAEVASL